MVEIDAALLAILFGVAVVAGGIDAIAGGGGLLTVPALLTAGLDPVTAVATNKLQGVFGTASAAATFARAGMIRWRSALPMAAVAAAGSVAGAMTVGLLPSAALVKVMPVLLVAAALYFAFSPSLSKGRGMARLGRSAFGLTLVPAVGFYDGFFGPGAGSLYLLGLVALTGVGVLEATAETKLLNFASNLGSLILFIIAGAALWPIGLVMGLGAILGARLGSVLALRNGARLIRPLLVIVSLATALRLLLG